MKNIFKRKPDKSGVSARYYGSRAEHIQGYLFLGPGVIIASIFIAAAVLFVLFMSFMRVDMFRGTFEFIGFRNYVDVLTDPIFRIALGNTLRFSAVVVPIQTFIALVLASVLNSKIKGKTVFRAIYFLPTLTSSSALTLIFMFMFNVRGPVNSMLMDMGIISSNIDFLGNPSWALPVIMLMNIWSTVPFYMTLYLASLQDLPSSMYEAAAIDGAGPAKTFFYITIPYLKPITTFVLVTGIIGTLQMFDQAYIFSNGSGGPQNSTLVLALMVYRRAFGTMGMMGNASALAIVLAVIIMILAQIAKRLNKEERVY